MNWKLLLHACTKFFSDLLLVSGLLFAPAGTLRFWNAWLLLGVLFVPMFLAGLVLWVKNSALLAKCLHSKETQLEQKTVILLSGLMFLAGFLTAGLDFCFGWSHIPKWLTAAAVVLFLLAYLLYAQVIRENAFLSRTVEIQENQRVIDTGLYGVVRHPMYAATLLLFLTMPVILGSLASLVIFLTYPILIVRRIQSEEQVLSAGLEGYEDYRRRVRYRLVPFLW